MTSALARAERLQICLIESERAVGSCRSGLAFSCYLVELVVVDPSWLFLAILWSGGLPALGRKNFGQRIEKLK